MKRYSLTEMLKDIRQDQDLKPADKHLMSQTEIKKFIRSKRKESAVNKDQPEDNSENNPENENDNAESDSVAESKTLEEAAAELLKAEEEKGGDDGG